MKLVAASSALLATIFAGTCPDIQDDPFVSFHGPGVENNLDNMVFKQYCGPTTTGSANATDINSIAQGDFEKAHCRMKCKNWDTNYDQFGLSKLFWAKTKGRWKRTKYLYCRCKNNASGEEVCHWKRRARTDREKAVQDLDITRNQPKNQIEIACEVPTCQHVSTIPEYNAGGRVPKITTGREVFIQVFRREMLKNWVMNSNAVAELSEKAKIAGLAEPHYEIGGDRAGHTFQSICHFQGTQTYGIAGSKGVAQKISAQNMLNGAKDQSWWDYACRDSSGNKITVCENCNINDNRNGVWTCYDKQGVELANDVRVPWRGWCSMSCGNEAVESPARKKVHCKWPHFEDDSVFAYQQYEPRKVFKLYNMLQKKRFRDDVNMDAEEGWKCYE